MVSLARPATLAAVADASLRRRGSLSGKRRRLTSFAAADSLLPTGSRAGSATCRGSRRLVRNACVSQETAAAVGAAGARDVPGATPRGGGGWPGPAGSEPSDAGSGRAGICGRGNGRNGGDTLVGFGRCVGPCIVNRNRASRYTPDRNEPGGGRRDSSGGRSGKESDVTARGSPHWLQKLWSRGFSVEQEEQTRLKTWHLGDGQALEIGYPQRVWVVGFRCTSFRRTSFRRKPESIRSGCKRPYL